MNKKSFYYGYAVVAASTVIMIVGYGAFYSYSIFFDSLESAFKWSSGATSLAFSLAVPISL